MVKDEPREFNARAAELLRRVIVVARREREQHLRGISPPPVKRTSLTTKPVTTLEEFRERAAECDRLAGGSFLRKGRDAMCYAPSNDGVREARLKAERRGA